MIKLICFDMDGVIFKDINFWMELHKIFETLEEGEILTEKYLHTDYDKLVEEVVNKLWKGRDSRAYYRLVESLEYLPGVKETFEEIKKNDVITAIISGSSIDVARRAQRDLGIDHIYANELIIKDGKISGEFIWPIGAGKEKKAEIVKHLTSDLNILLRDVVYIGDSDMDIEAFKIVGKSIAFNSSSDNLKKVADIVVESDDLRKIISYLFNS
ncbi:HAD family phosphatase [Candidatus Woesearchaeota archaeon]|nr:HAD family phosphatase [Candidatus Woesearchaeota archaeon]